MCAKYLVEAGAMGVRRVRKLDLKKIAKASGAQLLMTMANMDGEETFESNLLGEAEEVCVEWVSDNEIVLVKGYVVRAFLTVAQNNLILSLPEQKITMLPQSFCGVQTNISSMK